MLCDMANKPLRCRLGFHKWGPQHTSDGEKYLGCVRCHKRTDPPEGGIIDVTF